MALRLRVTSRLTLTAFSLIAVVRAQGATLFVNPNTTDTGVAEGAIVDIGVFEFQAGAEPIPTLSSWSVLILTLGIRSRKSHGGSLL